MTVTLTNDKSAAVDQDYFWRPLDSCPLGTKVQLLTRGGIAVYGQYIANARSLYLGWAPLPKRPEWMR